jgi:poly-gamma-glutamate synthesis protein (capsule biosynthesis protein)
MQKILIAGDFCPRYRIDDLLNNGDSELILSNIAPIISESNYSIVNLEYSVCERGLAPIDKCGPNLRSNVNSLDLLVNAGFKCVTLANNHINDFGDEGMRQTLASLRTKRLDYLGAGLNLQESQKILYKTILDKKVAFVNVAEHEFTIATENNAGAAPLDICDVTIQINEAKKNADFVIVIIHGGHEHYQLPSPRMKKTYRYFIDMGANVVVNHHQHCYSGYEIYKKSPIFYGLGNFCFDDKDKRNDIWNYGYMVKLSIAKSITFELIPYRQCDDTPTVSLLNECELNVFHNKLKELNAIITNDALLEKHYEEFCRTKYLDKSLSLVPYSNRYLLSLYIRKMLPSFITKKRLKLAFAFVNCESHRDIFMNYLKNGLK